jgi:hypothetical protein
MEAEPKCRCGASRSGLIGNGPGQRKTPLINNSSQEKTAALGAQRLLMSL